MALKALKLRHQRLVEVRRDRGIKRGFIELLCESARKVKLIKTLVFKTNVLFNLKLFHCLGLQPWRRLDFHTPLSSIATLP